MVRWHNVDGEMQREPVDFWGRYDAMCLEREALQDIVEESQKLDARHLPLTLRYGGIATWLEREGHHNTGALSNPNCGADGPNATRLGEDGQSTAGRAAGKDSPRRRRRRRRERSTISNVCASSAESPSNNTKRAPPRALYCARRALYSKKLYSALKIFTNMATRIRAAEWFSL